MMTFTRGVAACALALGCLSAASAATICVQNPQTGQFEPRGGSGGDARDCARHNQAPQRDAAQASQDAAAPRSAAAVVAAGARPPAVAQQAAKPAPAWTLRAGRTIGQELAAWGEKAGWKVVWSMQKDWAIPANTSFEGDFKTAASAVITNLAGNGALVRAQFYDGNNTLVVIGPGVTPQ
jgi:hypothetical protein